MTSATSGRFFCDHRLRFQNREVAYYNTPSVALRRGFTRAIGAGGTLGGVAGFELVVAVVVFDPVVWDSPAGGASSVVPKREASRLKSPGPTVPSRSKSPWAQVRPVRPKLEARRLKSAGPTVRSWSASPASKKNGVTLACAG